MKNYLYCNEVVARESREMTRIAGARTGPVLQGALDLVQKDVISPLTFAFIRVIRGRSLGY